MDDHSDHAAAAEPELPALPPPLPNDPSPSDDANAATADEGYTPVYAENRSFAAAATAAGVKRKSGAPAQPAQRFYAVRSGLNVTNCVFFRWQDAEPQVSVALADDSNLHIEFEEFDDIDDAWEYIATGDAPEVARPRKRSKKSSGYGDSTPGASSPARRIYGRPNTRSLSILKLATATASSRPGRSRRPSCRAGCPARGSSIATSRRGRRRP